MAHFILGQKNGKLFACKIGPIVCHYRVWQGDTCKGCPRLLNGLMQWKELLTQGTLLATSYVRQPIPRTFA